MRRPLFEIVEVRPIDVDDGPVDHAALMDQLMHDCPLCREALARGERPIVGMFPVAPGRHDDRDAPDDPNWWQGRRRRRKRRGRR